MFKLGYAKALSLSPDTGSDLWEVLLPGNHEQVGAWTYVRSHIRTKLANALQRPMHFVCTWPP